ncbi:MAG: ankyrin [Bdellovibrio sp. ArHS]|uniref:ankyrin repeat domain-containing protein n=1 Tax=Bdellovibrio sp. ArHS TaxID=1569284 RepID=UPI0005836F5C|nr:ankyrin repeat domain-containing protein [Bdellovibrio sp. ArHS]KHD88382.1 MAG: ankyrin [Bdellovibrio sp. ArHS]
MSAGDWKEMYSAAQRGDMELVRYHIENGVNPNYQHPEILATPLVAAIAAGHTEVALYLLEHKADPRLKSFFDDQTPLEAATFYKNKIVLEELRKRGVQPKLSFWRALFGGRF